MSEQKEVAIIELPKITVKLSATKIVEEEKEIEVPAFVKYSNLIFYKIISQTKMICVTCSESGTFTEIEIKDNVSGYIGDNIEREVGCIVRYGKGGISV